MDKQALERIANRHVARCLSKIDEVHALPEMCADAVRREMHYCAVDVLEAISEAIQDQGASEYEHEDQIDGNR